MVLSRMIGSWFVVVLLAPERECSSLERLSFLKLAENPWKQLPSSSSTLQASLDMVVSKLRTKRLNSTSEYREKKKRKKKKKNKNKNELIKIFFKVQ
jgi:hypothetical protein